MNAAIRAYAAHGPGETLQPFEYEPGPLGAEEVEIAVEHCGICHSDLSVIDNEWGNARYPVVPGHEAVGRVVAVGERAARVAVGDRVGIGWFSGSCMHCHQCLSGDHNLCGASEATILGRHGGFADRLRAHWSWTVPLPEALDHTSAGPLFCGGITVFNPIVQFGVLPTHRVGVIGIGGLGHLALQFLAHWGCEVTALTSSASKRSEALALGAHYVEETGNADSLRRLRGHFDFLLVTVNVPLDWPALLGTLAPRGRLHVVGAVLEPMGIPAFGLIGGQKSVSGSPVGSPAVMAEMLEFCARHRISPAVERYPMSQVNEAISQLRHGKPRYRIVLDAD